MLHPRLCLAPAIAFAAAVALSGCDVGDGTTLQAPVAPTTTAPPDTTPLPSVPLDDSLDDSLLDGAFEELPTESLPGFPDGAAGFSVAAPWPDGGDIDVRHTCDDVGDSPAISWSAVPAGTVELAISLVDESRISNGQPIVHWVMAGIDATLPGIASNELPPGAFEALNFFGEEAYTGPCPDLGQTSVYTLTLHAVGQQVEAGFGSPAAQVLEVIDSVTIATVTVTGQVTR